MTIPKTIHYVWFGGNQLTGLGKKCLKSWERYCPDYTIVRWDETNFDLNMNNYVREASEEKKWAFISDVARLFVLYNYGGIYMDTDVEVIRSLDSLLQYEAVSGFESPERVSTGLMACVKGHTMFKKLLNEYEDRHFRRPDGSLDLTTNVTSITNACKEYGLRLDNSLQTINGLTLLPQEYLCPKDAETGDINITSNTYCIHHFDGSWVTEEDRYSYVIAKRLSRYLPNSLAGYVARFIATSKYSGVGSALSDTLRWMRRNSIERY